MSRSNRPRGTFKGAWRVAGPLSVAFVLGSTLGLCQVAGASASTPSRHGASGSGGHPRLIYTNRVVGFPQHFATSPTDLQAAKGHSRPAITSQPVSVTVAAGSTASFSAAASGSPTPTVQWQFSANRGGSWSNVPGANSRTYSLSTTKTSENGREYRAVFTNSSGSARTNAATLTVTGPVSAPPTITSQPVSVTVAAGSTASFSAAASGSPTPTVQWQFSADGGTSWSNISGATSTTYSFSTTTTENGYEYEAVFTNSSGSATTNAATLTFTGPVSAPPTITSQPVSVTVAAGSTASFSAAASGSPTPTVQWQFSADGGTSWSNISGATSTTYSFTTTIPPSENGYEYEAVFTNSSGSATTNAATLTFTGPVSAPPTITSQPVSVTVAAGSTASFSAAASGSPTPTVQWQFSADGGTSWSNISGATSTTYSFTTTIPPSENGYEYEAVFTNSSGSATTNAATLTFTGPVSGPPTITSQPVSVTVAAGSTASFSAAASGSPTPTVQWQFSADGGTSWSNISGATSTTYSFTTTIYSENGYEYEAVFTNSSGSATTNAATLTVTAAPAQSSNWSGYADTGSGFSAVSGSWTVPTVSCTEGSSYSAHWIGIDGATSSTVEQDGTEADCVAGSGSYDAWYEMYGDSAVNSGNEVELSPSSYPVFPGDEISASVSVVGGTWTLAISDSGSASQLHSWSFSTNIVFSGAAQSSAEWIVERPDICNALSCSLATLANFGTVTFTNAAATENGIPGSVSTWSNAAIEMLNGSTPIAVPGSLDPTGSIFTDTYE